jgi:hypothetical protein
MRRGAVRPFISGPDAACYKGRAGMIRAAFFVSH